MCGYLIFTVGGHTLGVSTRASIELFSVDEVAPSGIEGLPSVGGRAGGTASSPADDECGIMGVAEGEPPA